MTKQKKQEIVRVHFPTVPLAEAVDTRVSRHGKIVSEILTDLEQLDEFSAIKINLVEAGKTKADLRSALHRAAKKNNVHLATTSDDRTLYVFRPLIKSR
jgi:hypothetical protein